MAITIDDVTEAAASGVLRALEAHKGGKKGLAAHPEDLSTAALVRSGFYVNVHIIAGGIRPGPVWETSALNPQPLPPGRHQQ